VEFWNRPLAIAVGVLSALLPAVVGTALGWPAPLWLVLSITLLAIVLMVGRVQTRRTEQAGLRAELLRAPSAPQPPTHERIAVSDVALPSGAPDYEFRFSATVCWRQLPGARLAHANPASLAEHSIIARAGAVVADEDPRRVGMAQRMAAGALGAVQPDQSGTVEAWAELVELTLPDTDRERLRRLADVRKDEEVWEHERAHERNKRAYLGNDVLKSTGSAVVWWLARRDQDVLGTVALIGALAQLSSAANNTEVPELFRHLVGTPAVDVPWPEPKQADPVAESAPPSATDLVEQLMDAVGLAEDERVLFADRLDAWLSNARGGTGGEGLEPQGNGHGPSAALEPHQNGSGAVTGESVREQPGGPEEATERSTPVFDGNESGGVG
jgi:hypothetical protein